MRLIGWSSDQDPPIIVRYHQLAFKFDGRRVEVVCIAPGTHAKKKVTQEETLKYNRRRQKRLRQNRPAF